jgi:hypothetical protein
LIILRRPLATGTKIGAARGLSNADNFCVTIQAGFPGAVINAQPFFIITFTIIAEIEEGVGFSADGLQGNGTAKFYGMI